MITTAFSESLFELRELLKYERVEALSDAYYEVSHQRFEGVSSQRSEISKIIKGTIAELNSDQGRQLRWLSVGCGAGHLDLPILEAVPSIEHYVGLDPNAEQLKMFKAATTRRGGAVLINSTLENWKPVHLFDLVTAVHVLYYVAHPSDFLNDLLSAKAASGICLLAIAPRSPMNLIAELFWQRQSVEPVFSEDVESILTSLNVRFSKKSIQAHIPLSCLSGARADQMVIDFTVQANTANLPPRIKACLDSNFHNAAIRVGSEMVLDHPVDIFFV